jgi:hypothetical protein
VERAEVELEFVGTQDQLFTKALGRVRFLELHEKIGIKKLALFRRVK